MSSFNHFTKPSFNFEKFESMAENGVDTKTLFLKAYEALKDEILSDPSSEYIDDSRQWIDQMLDYNVPKGKLNRGLAVINSYKLIKQGNVSEEEFFLGAILGWSLEWLQACFLILDDITDKSHTRRGQPCWFRLPKVGTSAISDGILLHNHTGRLHKKYFRNKSYYADLIDLFNEVAFQTATGQMFDLITTNEGEIDLLKYKMPTYLLIVEFKTAYYSFYLPIACALLMAGENLENHVALKRIAVQMGTYFQVQDDYLDCFGDPEITGKIGTDIEDHKCSWLVVQALERANDSQRQRLYDNYGKKDPACVSEVKTVYDEIKIKDLFLEYENTSYSELISAIEAGESEPLQLILTAFLSKIYKRHK